MSDIWLPNEMYEENATRAVECLSGQLAAGTLGLFIGAGVSQGLGLPLWWELVRDCLKQAALPADDIGADTENAQLRLAVDKLEKHFNNRAAYLDHIRTVLYKDLLDTDSLARHSLLVAIGAMMIKSKRGSCTTVLTLNFDDLIERYLRLYGFVAQPVGDLPCLLHDSDVTVYHPHGYLPSGSADGAGSSSRLVFSQYSYDRLFVKEGLWRNLVSNLLLSKVTLFVGLSYKDPTFGPLLLNVKELLLEASDDRPTGFWLLGPGDGPESEDFLRDRNVVPLRRSDYHEYPALVLSICRAAMELA